MSELIPPFHWHTFLFSPWNDPLIATSNFWIVLMGFMVATACGLVGNYLIVRRMALVGDAISHSVLPGIAIAFLVSQTRGSTAMFIGALIAGIVTTIIIEVIHKKTRVKQDAAIGIAFTSLFAIGVILISLFAAQIDLDQECVLYGEIGYIGPEALAGEHTRIFGIPLGPITVARMILVTIATCVLIALFYKELLVSSFDPGLASSLGINATMVHYGLMSWLSVVVVSSFESVGAILVIGMLILPGATAALLTARFPRILLLTVLNAALSSLGGVHLATWLNCSPAGAMVVMASLLFSAAWIFSPHDGLIRRWYYMRGAGTSEPSEATVELTSK
ncbi:MAG: metal ABC transporter permease [Verrucomicrobia bacterium]|nr:metal ABC transporter permease [Verrucomicrobiota bacterium]